MAQQTLGFVGVGRMGSLMAPRLVNAGHDVFVFDTSVSAMAEMVKLGAKQSGSIADLSDTAETIFLSLPKPEIVHIAALGKDGLSRGKRVKRVVDLSTIGPSMAETVAAALLEQGIAYIDAPVSGGLKGAREGTLAVMVACPMPLFVEIEPILKIFGKPFHLGEIAGQAQTMKLANNLLSVAAMVLSSEAMVMGVKAGLNPKMMLDVINTSTGRNSATQDKFPRAILPGTFDFGFATGLSHKDVKLCVDEAEAMGVPMVCGAAVCQMMAITNALYGPDSDFTSVCKVVESWGGVEVRG